MQIGILQTGHAPDALIPDHGDYPAFFERLLAGQGLDFTTFAVCDGEMPPGLEAAEGWLITGSRHGAYEDHAWIPPLEDFIRQVHAAGQPMVGICFGHQVIAQALGGRVEKFDGGWSVGRTDYVFDDTAGGGFAGEVLSLNAWHQDQVTRAPDGARLLASSNICRNAALAYGDSILTIQPHPEFTAPVVAGLIDGRGRGVVPDALLDRAQAVLDRPVDTDRAARMIGDFLKGTLRV